MFNGVDEVFDGVDEVFDGVGDRALPVTAGPVATTRVRLSVGDFARIYLGDALLLAASLDEGREALEQALAEADADEDVLLRGLRVVAPCERLTRDGELVRAEARRRAPGAIRPDSQCSRDCVISSERRPESLHDSSCWCGA